MAEKKTNINTRRMSGLSGSARRLSGSARRSDDNHVNVAIRCRPMSEKEISDGHQSIVEFESPQRIVIHDTSAAPSDQLGTKSGERHNYSHVYDFDYVFDCKSTQRGVYDQVCRPIVDSVLEGYNGTIFAYGQTGTGKTYTMEGTVDSRRLSAKQRLKDDREGLRSDKDSNQNGETKSQQSSACSDENRENVGIIPRTFEQIFEHVAKNPEIQFLVRASYLEIYQEDIHDLLRKDRSIKLELHERPDIGVYVKDLTSFVCKSITEIGRVMKVGNQNRKVGATDMNEHSSRSHAIFMITVEQQSTIGDKEHNQKDNRVIRVGKLNLVDLAGSERQRKTNSFGERQKESIKINLSLSALGNVINSLMKISTHQQQQSNNKLESGGRNISDSFTPYRDSKLTRLLQDSLGGNAKTLMIANIGPASYNYDETINTLNYASRAKCIRNKPRLNEDPKDALLRELQHEIDDLRSKLAAMGSDSALPAARGERLSMKGEQRGGKAANNPELNVVESEQPLVEKELIALRQKLSSLESKLLNGDKSASKTLDKRLLQGYTREQELALEKNRVELADQAHREKAIRDELERRDEAELLAKESFSSIRQEMDAKKQLIRQILVKIRTMRDEIESTQKAYRLELDELDQLQYVLQKEFKLKCLIMDNFIPNNHVDNLLSHIVFDEKKNRCSINAQDLSLDYCNLGDQEAKLSDFRPSSKSSARPRSEFERICETIYPGNIRYRGENLIEPKLEVISCGEKRNLAEQDTGSVKLSLSPAASHVQNLIDSALSQHDPDIVI